MDTIKEKVYSNSSSDGANLTLADVLANGSNANLESISKVETFSANKIIANNQLLLNVENSDKTVQWGASDHPVTFFQFLGQDGNDFNLYSINRDEYVFKVDGDNNQIIFNEGGNARFKIDNDNKTVEFYSNDPYFQLDGENRRFRMGDYTYDWYGTWIDINDDANIKQILLKAGNGVKVNDYVLPKNDGTSGQVIKTDGAGTLSFEDLSGGVLVEVEQLDQSASISETVIYDDPHPRGMYRLNLYVEAQNLAIAGTVLTTLKWASNGQFKTYITDALALTSLNNSQVLCFSFMCGEDEAITYETTVAGLVGGSYNINIKLEKL